MNWFRKWFPKKKSVLLQLLTGEWVMRTAYLSESGWICELWGYTGNTEWVILNEDGTCDGRYCRGWLPT